VASGSAAGKAILLGEHAVVYGRPAVAVPLSDLRATAEVHRSDEGSGVLIRAEDLGRTYRLGERYADDDAEALQVTVRNAMERFGVAPAGEDLAIAVRSRIPVARGLGSGTAVATAMVRALARHYGNDLPVCEVSDLVYRTEVILHGTPSGVDNTVVAHERPVWFRRDVAPVLLALNRPLALVIADTGVPANTRGAVAAVRERREADPDTIDALFDAIGALAEEGRAALAEGDRARLGALMSRNHEYLRALGVSTPALDHIIEAAREAGALGAKLSGGGRGGCAIALVTAWTRDAVATAVVAAGAVQVYVTEVRPECGGRRSIPPHSATVVAPC
jgi:mevalonate kinase